MLGLVTGGTLPDQGDTVVALMAGALGYGLSITLWVQGARDLGAARGQLVFSAAPFVGAAVAWSVFDDPVRTVEVVALVLAVFGVSQVLWSTHVHEHAHEPLLHEHEHEHDEHHQHHDELVLGRHSHLHRHAAARARTSPRARSAPPSRPLTHQPDRAKPGAGQRGRPSHAGRRASGPADPSNRLPAVA